MAEVSERVVVGVVGMNVCGVRGGLLILPRKPQRLTSKRRRRLTLVEMRP